MDSLFRFAVDIASASKLLRRLLYPSESSTPCHVALVVSVLVTAILGKANREKEQ